MDRLLIRALLGELAQHRQERRKPRAAREEQERPRHVAEIEAARRAGELNRRARLRLADEAAHPAARDVADQEGEPLVGGRRGEGVGPALARPRHPDVDVLPRQEADRTRAFQREGECRLRQPLDRGDGRLAGLGLGLAHGRGRRDVDHQIGLRHRLAGEGETLRRFIVGQRVLDVEARLEGAAGNAALAGAAGAVAAVERDVDAEPVGGIRHGLAVPGLDEAGRRR